MKKRRTRLKKVKKLSSARSSQKTIKKIDPDTQYLIYRSAKTGKAVKYSKRTKLIVEVRSKKSKKVVGYLNKFSRPTKKRPRDILSRKFTRLELGLKARVETKRVQVQSTDTFHFRINFSELIMDQVLEQTIIFKALRKIIKQFGILLLGLEVHTSNDFQLYDGYKIYKRPDAKGDHLEKESAIRILQLLRSQAIRTSAKKHQPKSRRNRKDKMPRSADVYLLVGD